MPTITDRHSITQIIRAMQSGRAIKISVSAGPALTEAAEVTIPFSMGAQHALYVAHDQIQDALIQLSLELQHVPGPEAPKPTD